MALKDDIFDLILHAEEGYKEALKGAMAEAGKYVDGCREKQSAYIEELRQGWDLYEKAETERFAVAISEEERKMEAETAEYIKQLRTCQEAKAEIISQRIKEEVLSSIWQ
jgi:hypothetical protein